jgi:hypothetical protein
MAHARRLPISLTSIALVIAALVLAMAGPAAAHGPPLHGEGTGQLAITELVELRAPGPNSIQYRELTGEVEGALEGTIVQRVTGTVHGAGHVTFRGIMEFTGTVAGCGDEEHTLTLGLTGKGLAGAAPVTESTVRALGGQGQAGPDVVGVGTVLQDGFAITYSLRYVCR